MNLIFSGLDQKYVGEKDNSVCLFFCPNNCGRKYKHKTSLRAHLRFECGVPKQFSCEICGKSFALKHNFRTHMGLVHRLAV